MIQDDLISVISRLHTVDGDAMHLLGRMLLSLYGSSHELIQPVVVTQGFSAEDLQKVKNLLNDFIWSESVEPKVVNFEPLSKGDYRAALINLGIGSANGRFLALLDYDDYVYEHAYETLIKKLRSSRSAVAFGGCRASYAEATIHGYKQTFKDMPWSGKTLDDFLADNIFPPVSFVIDRTKVDPSVLHVDERLTRLEDYYLLLRLRAVSTFDMTYFETPLCEYIIRQDGTTTAQLGAGQDTLANQRCWEFSRKIITPLRLSLQKLRGLPNETLDTLATHALEKKAMAEQSANFGKTSSNQLT